MGRVAVVTSQVTEQWLRDGRRRGALVTLIGDRPALERIIVYGGIDDWRLRRTYRARDWKIEQAGSNEVF